jgi:hypothetical protein
MFLNIPLLKTINNFENKDRHNPNLSVSKDNYLLQLPLQFALFFSNTEKHNGKIPNPVIINVLVSIPFFSAYKLADKTITPLIVLLLLHLPLVSVNNSFTAFNKSVIGLTPPLTNIDPIH